MISRLNTFLSIALLVALTFELRAANLDPLEAKVRAIAEQSAKQAAAEAEAEAEAARRAARLAAAEAKTAGAPLRLYKFHESGATAYSDRRPAHSRYQVVVYDSCYACGKLPNVNWNATKLFTGDFERDVNDAARLHGVDPALVRAVIHAESAFNPLARSRKGASGLMQLMPGTASDMGVTDVWDARDNIFGGTRYLALMLKRFDNNVTLATAAYNAGPGNVERYSGVPPFDETRTYVSRVSTLHQRYQAQTLLAKQ